MDIDDRLGALASSAVPAGLDDIGEAVFARIASDRRARRAQGYGLLAAVGVATVAGVAGAAIPARHGGGAAAALLAPAALAPSTLLEAGE